MLLRTVVIKMPDDTSPRDFHIAEHKVARFVAKIKAEGGTAKVGPYSPSADLLAMLTKAGVPAAAIAKIGTAS